MTPLAIRLCKRHHLRSESSATHADWRISIPRCRLRLRPADRAGSPGGYGAQAPMSRQPGQESQFPPEARVSWWPPWLKDLNGFQRNDIPKLPFPQVRLELGRSFEKTLGEP